MTQPESTSERTGWQWALLAFTLLIVVPVVILLASNPDSVRVKWWNWSWRPPLYALLLGTFVAGVVVDEVVGLVWRGRRRRQQKLHAELADLRRRAAAPAEVKPE